MSLSIPRTRPASDVFPQRASPILSIESVARWFGQRPAGVLRGRQHAASAALWQFEADSAREIGGEADPETDIVSIAAGGSPVQSYFGDGKLRFCSRAAPGLLNLVPAGEKPSATFEDSPRFRYLQVFMPHALLSELAEHADCPIASERLTLIAPGCARDREIERLGREIVVEMEAGLPMAPLRFDALVLDLGVQLLRRHSNVSSRLTRRVGPAGGLAPWQVRRACELMRADLAADVHLRALADAAGCSPSHFSRAFQQAVGMPPFQWLLLQRIEAAQSLIAQRVPLAEVALAVGFAAQPQFTTAFRRVTGETPAAWGRRNRTG